MKKILFAFCTLLLSVFSFSQEKKHQLSTHILDITTGTPATNVTVILERQQEKNWIKIDEKKTDSNGRIPDFLAQNNSDGNLGVYRLTFITKPYFDSNSIETFYPFIQVIFQIKNNTHYHVPITLSPFGYSTYRGS